MTFWQIWLRQPMQQPNLCGLGRSAGTPSAPLRLAGEAVIGRLGDIATKLPHEVIEATPEIPSAAQPCVDPLRTARRRLQHGHAPANPRVPLVSRVIQSLNG
jgi:hypothetical protein